MKKIFVLIIISSVLSACAVDSVPQQRHTTYSQPSHSPFQKIKQDCQNSYNHLQGIKRDSKIDECIQYKQQQQVI